MPVVIYDIEAGSLASRAGIVPGETLLSINGREVNDVLDYRFLIVDRHLELSLIRPDGGEHHVTLRKSEYDDPGLLFETYLMDKQRACRNKCVFCFIDQLPKGMRESLYFKDDDARLSFLFGNYITLTNLSDREVQRIIDMHISPINISVHTTDPDLRCRMMGNRFAGESLRHLWHLAEAGTHINCQMVLCPGLNDGPQLDRTLSDLTPLYPAVQSIAAVPVGLTAYRDGLYPLTGYTPEGANAVIDQIDAFGDRCVQQFGSRVCYAADEFYLKAGRPLPPPSFYEDFCQLENGVGTITLLKDQFMDALHYEDFHLDHPREVTIATGVSVAPTIQSLIDEAVKKWHNLTVHVAPIVNYFFGTSINVSGLVTGTDLKSQLKDKPLGSEVIIPSSMLRFEGDLFLDDVSVVELSEYLGVPIVPVSVDDGQNLLDAVLGIGSN